MCIDCSRCGAKTEKTEGRYIADASGRSFHCSECVEERVLEGVHFESSSGIGLFETASKKEADLVSEANKLVRFALRDNSYLEEIHAGKTCPECGGNQEYSHISEDDMAKLWQDWTRNLASALKLMEESPRAYGAMFKGDIKEDEISEIHSVWPRFIRNAEKFRRGRIEEE